jgi:hypothetical protein
MSHDAFAIVLADSSGAYWFAGVLTLAAAFIVMVVMLSESKANRTP